MAVGRGIIGNLPVLVTLIVGITLSMVGYHVMKGWEEDRLAKKFEHEAVDRIKALQHSIDMTLSQLQSLGAFYKASGEVTRREFSIFVSPIVAGHEAIQALEWIPRVPAARREAFVRRAREEGHPAFDFRERLSQGIMGAAAPRDEYFPVYFVQPFEGNEKALGFDLGSEPTRLASLVKAAETGKIVATARITLVQEKESHFGMLVFLPVYGLADTPSTVEGRREKLTGFVLGVFRISDMVASSLPRLAGEKVIDTFVFDVTSSAEQQILFSSVPKVKAVKDINHKFLKSKTIRVGGREWLIVIAATEDSYLAEGIPDSLTLLVVGMMLTLFIALYIKINLTRRMQIEKLVKRRTDELLDTATGLAESEERLRAIHDTVLDGIITIDEKGKIASANPAAERIFGYSQQEMLGNNVNMLMPEPYKSEHDGYLNNFLTTGTAKIIGLGREVEGRRKDGTTFPLDLAVNKIFLKDQYLFTGVVKDITERKQIDQLKSEFIATVSHELRTPLASIVGYVDMVLDGDAGEITGETKEFLDIVSKNGLRLSNLINDLLDVEKIENGRINIEREALPLEEILNAVSATFKILAGQKGLHLELDVPDGLEIEGDLARLMQVFSNLVSNAVKYTKEGEVRISAEQKADRVVVTIADTGIGMSEEAQKFVFEKFFRADDEYAKSAGGTGLGLAIVKAIVLEHHGEISFQSELGKGSQFVVTLPIPQVRKIRAVPTVEPQAEPTFGCGVLFIGNSTYNMDLVRSSLEGIGLECLSTTSGEDGLKLARNHHPKLVLMEVLQDNGDGWELVQKFKNDPAIADIPLVFVSLLSGQEEILELGASAFILKKVSPNELEIVLKEILEREGANRRILIVDDDQDFGKVLAMALKKLQVFADVAHTGNQALEMCRKDPYGLVLVDFYLGEMLGIELVKTMKLELGLQPAVVLISGATIDAGIEQQALTLGAKQFLNKKIGVKDIAHAIKDELGTRGNRIG